jgi:choline dehydrogenase-like flavoprotein
MAHLTVVGAGASAVHFALTALRNGHRVTMLDVGYSGRPDPLPEETFEGLKRSLDDPADYLLGPQFDGVVLPGTEGEYYGIPPSKSYVFEAPAGQSVAVRGFEPLFSYARGGLAQAWTGGCYPFNDDDLADFPFGYDELRPHYEEVARRIGVTGKEDDLARFLPFHGDLMEPLDLDPHSTLLMERYADKRDRLNSRLGYYMGRTRVATLSRDRGDRKACDYLGRCIWGCPRDSLYTPAYTLKECLGLPGFEYRKGCLVTHFRAGSEGRVRAVVYRDPAGRTEELPVDLLVLAAGTLSSSRIVLRSVQLATGEAPVLSGLMDNRQVLVPFLNLRMLGRSYPERSYQYHLIGLGLTTADPRAYVHGQVTTLKSAMLHPIIQRLPLDLRASTRIVRALHAALAVVNLNFHDTRRPENRVTLREGPDGPDLSIEYVPPADEDARVKAALGRLGRALRSLGCMIAPGMTHVRPMGASVHYAGTLPMSTDSGRWTTSPEGVSRDFDNLILADGTTFPFLPAKNGTFTLMANAVRIAEALG